MRRHLHALVAVLTVTTALAQTADNVLGLEQMPAAATPATPAAGSGQQSAYTEFYPIKINLGSVTRAGVTPNAGYVLVRDLKGVLEARNSGDLYTLHTPGSELRFRPGARAATFNGQPATLNATPVRIPDTLLFPVRSLSLLGCAAQPLAAMQESRPYRITCGDGSVIVSVVTFTNGNAAAGAVQPSAAVASRLRTQALRSAR